MTRTRSFRAYSMHGRSSETTLDYEQFFEWLSSLPPSHLEQEVRSDLTFAVHDIQVRGEDYYIRIASGDPSERPTFYDARRGELIYPSLGDDRWPATVTHVVARPSARVLSLELRRAGVGAGNLERYLRQVALEQGYTDNFVLDLNPIPTRSFLEELESFTRIREASLVVRRPNTDWDDAEDVLSGLADQSGGHQAEIGVKAARGDGLTRNSGVLALIKEHVTRRLTNVVNARVTGSTADQPQRTVSLERHQLQKRVPVPATDGPVEDDFEAAQNDLLDEASVAQAQESIT